VLHVQQGQLLLRLHQLTLDLRVGQLRLVQRRLERLEVGSQVAVLGLEPVVRREQRPGKKKS
jgi:hypothetical protein